jgi:hypothetical protein
MKLNDIQKSALVCALFGLGLIILFSVSGKVLPRSQLTQIQGEIDWVKATGKHGNNLRFKFINNDTHLIYHSIGGQTSKTHSALANKSSVISVLYDQSDSHSPPSDENSYHTIYELTKDGSIVRSYESMVKAYASNSRLAGWAGLVSLFIAGIFFVVDRRKQNQTNKKINKDT